MTAIHIRPAIENDMQWAVDLWREEMGIEIIVVHGEKYDLTTFPGLVADLGDQRAGIATYRRDEAGDYELLSIHCPLQNQGAGTSLIEAVIREAQSKGARRLWLITTNDNTAALRWYQRRGFRLRALYRDAVVEARKLKPEIPLLGNDNIPITDEIELEMTF